MLICSQEEWCSLVWSNSQPGDAPVGGGLPSRFLEEWKPDESDGGRDGERADELEHEPHDAREPDHDLDTEAVMTAPWIYNTICNMGT